MLDVFETAARYQMYHALGLIAVAWAAARWPSPAVTLAGWCMVAGIVVFSGSLYVLSVTGIRWLGRSHARRRRLHGGVAGAGTRRLAQLGTGRDAAREKLRPSEVEQKWYRVWQERGYFRPEAVTDPTGDPFVMVIRRPT